MKKLTLILTAIFAATAMTASAQTLNLWNVNFAGGDDNNVTVDDGRTLVAGSFGGNQWNNIVSPNPAFDSWIPDNPLSMNDASGGNPFSLTWTEDGPEAGAPLDVHHAVNTGPEATLFHGYYGVGNIDSTMHLTGLDSDSVYDLHVYFTWGWNETPVDYSITTGSGSDLSKTLDPDQSTATYDDMAVGSNYVTFDGLSPDNGALDLRMVSGDGGISGFQLVQVPEPSTYAAIFGAVFLAFAIWRRRR